MEDPTGEVAQRYNDLAITVVQETSKLGRGSPTQVEWDPDEDVFKIHSEGRTFRLDPVTVRKNDTSARCASVTISCSLCRFPVVSENVFFCSMVASGQLTNGRKRPKLGLK